MCVVQELTRGSVGGLALHQASPFPFDYLEVMIASTNYGKSEHFHVIFSSDTAMANRYRRA